MKAEKYVRALLAGAVVATSLVWLACGSEEDPVTPGDAPPVCTLRPDTVDFGFVTVGSSTRRTLEIENTGDGTLTGNVAVSTAGPCDSYSIVSGGGPYSLTKGQIHTVIVSLDPASTGEKTCRIGAGSGCGDFVLRASSQEPTDCGVDPPAIDFGKVAVQTQRDTSFTITNTGGGVLTGNITESCDYVTILSGGGVYNLAAGESRVVMVRFEPSVSGAFACTIETGNDLCSDVTVSGVTEFPRFAAWVVGQVGTILRTVDGGENWERVTSGTTAMLIDVAFADTSKGLICGVGGRMLRTTNGGESWDAQVSGTTGSLVAISFPDANTATAVGNDGIIIRSTNGGVDWAPQDAGVTVHIIDVAFVDADNGWIVGVDGMVMRTMDGGENWSPLSVGSDRILSGVHFFDLNNGIVITAAGSWTQQLIPQILATSNGGADWTVRSPMAEGAYNVVVLTSETDAVVASASGELFFTSDLGNTWQEGSSGLQNVNGMDFINANIGVAAGYGGNLIQTFDGGATWVPRTTGTAAILRSVAVKRYQ